MRGRNLRIIAYMSAAVAGVALTVWSLDADAANPRIALVIGESAYADATLPTAANDAGLIAQVLQAAGFDVVGARDLDQKSVRESLRNFLDKANAAGPDMQAFVYFSGRALQYSGDNYLAPVDARIARDSDVPLEAVKLTDFTHALAAAPGLARVVVIDGARPNPYAQQGQPLAGGLALSDPEPNSVIAFNAAPGAIGVEDAGDYGIYAKSLAGQMRQGGVDINDVLAQVRVEVNQKTQGAQLPWSAGKFDSPYFLFERAADAAPVARRAPPKKPLKQLSAAEAYQVVVERDTLPDYEEFLRDHARSEQARRIEAILAARREALFWRRALEQNDPRAYWTYLRRYPKGPHAFDADRRLDTLSARREPPADFAVVEYQDLPPPPPAEIVYADRPVYYFGGDDFGPPPPPPPPDYVFYSDEDRDWRDLPPPPPPSIAGVLPALAIAIPLGIAARAYYGRPGAPAAAAPPPRPLGPPPLPKGVTVVARPEAAAPRPATPAGAAGQVRFAPPQATAPAGGRPPAPARTPAAAAAPQPVNGQTPAANPTRPPLPAPAATPTPNAARSPLPTPAATPAPAPNAVRSPAPAVTPAPAATPAPTPNAVRSPLPAPAVTPAPEAKPAHIRPTPESSRPATPEVKEKPAAKTPEARPAPETPKAPSPKPAAEPAKPKATEAPRAVETPRPAPTPRAEPKAEAAPRPELPKAAAAPRAEPPKAEPPKPAAAAACGHPGQPKC
jgi:uncharacterized caspase-like protein